jgi:hypothetical protein
LHGERYNIVLGERQRNDEVAPNDDEDKQARRRQAALSTPE